MRFKILETCELGGTTLEGRARCYAVSKRYEARASSKSSQPDFNVVIRRGRKRLVATTARELTDCLAEMTPTLREFAQADPGTICFLLAFLEDRGRPVRDTPLWRDNGAVCGRPVEELLPVLTGNTLAWHHLDIDDFKPKLVRNRFNVATGRFVERGAKVA